MKTPAAGTQGGVPPKPDASGQLRHPGASRLISTILALLRP
jgi:hypothetical protein